MIPSLFRATILVALVSTATLLAPASAFAQADLSGGVTFDRISVGTNTTLQATVVNQSGAR